MIGGRLRNYTHTHIHMYIYHTYTIYIYIHIWEIEVDMKRMNNNWKEVVRKGLGQSWIENGGERPMLLNEG